MDSGWIGTSILFVSLYACSSGNIDYVPDVTDTGIDVAVTDTENDVPDLKDVKEVAPPFIRPENGEPVDMETISAVTVKYLELLEKTRYFDATNERVHGWPRSDPDGRYWYGTWWSGVKVIKKDGKVTFQHKADGSDNNGMRTGPILSATCFAQALWGNQGDLVRKLVRGFNSWSLAMDRDSVPNDGHLLSRAHYPVSIDSTDDGVEYTIDYSLNRPGVDLDEFLPPSIYVHNPDNPWWGDVWVKNKRSKDDIGHMLEAIAILPGCTVDSDADFRADLDLLEDRYTTWCRSVENNDWGIVTIDEDWQEYTPIEDLAHYIEIVECKSRLALRLYGRADPGELDCGNGITPADEQWVIKNDFHQINRSHHRAATAMAFLREDHDTAHAMLDGLAWRLDTIFDARAEPDVYEGPHEQDLAESVVMSATVGVPLTWREVRFLHDRIEEAHASYLSDGMLPHYRVFDPQTPDGEYQYNPSGQGLFWRYLATPLGLCASPYLNPTSKPVLDCDRVRAYPSR